ncbi:drug/metabolite transporter (DMT)-like permease [Dysgonomonas sp. PH5-45]|uniref:DUF4405 domain-containing protein n=1 Tax=unclassified Dysgonomonas TaxID=2630389 RepID=UPI0024754F25|nr:MULTISPECIES: DUF4405 domain-containing protein [unclassified Dysgonomonas]MDH6354290.1 drug/metabolite transporter (DMT)-like permease [Dysgonomonas sp. PH5-45]MDH6387191.1 drug/metabolite transporter (DMT)-like permease [Dysgonomonas sp. PH5-37]
MEVLQKKSFSRRKFVSIGLFLTLLILIITGILIQVFERFEEGVSIHFFTAVHVLAGLVFAVLAVLHTVTNWRSLKAYIKNKGVTVSREAVWGVLLVAIIILIGFLFAHRHF